MYNFLKTFLKRLNLLCFNLIIKYNGSNILDLLQVSRNKRCYEKSSFLSSSLPEGLSKDKSSHQYG
jgi:hypothetical protein